MNSEVAAIWSTQTGLHTLMEGFAKQMESLARSGPTQEEMSVKDWRVSGESQVNVPPLQMELGNDSRRICKEF